MQQKILVIIVIVIAFLCGKFFQESREIEMMKQDPPRVFIEQLKTKMNITKNRSDIEIFLNGQIMAEDVKLELRK